MTDLGRFTLIGASLGQERTCVSGQTCSLDGIVGNHLSSLDRILVMDTCGASALIPRWPYAAHELSLTALAKWPYTEREVRASWGQSVVTAPGGQYRLCWCHGMIREDTVELEDLSDWPDVSDANTYVDRSQMLCSAAESFKVDMGTLTLVGVTPLLQYRTCIAGQNCSFDGILGVGLSNADRLAVMDTCYILDALYIIHIYI